MENQKETNTFLAEFLNAEDVYHKQNKDTDSSEKKKVSFKQVLKSLKDGNEIPVELDKWGDKTSKSSKLSKRTILFLMILVVLVPLTIWLGINVLGDRKYMFISILILVYSMCPFFITFEGRKPSAREIMLIAVWAALTAAARAVFYMVPNFKPVAAMVIIGGVTMGPECGFLVGCISLLVSNFIYGQGPWTPWLMVVFGVIGLLAGLFFQKGLIKRSRVSLCVYGFLSVIFIYGGIMNPASIIMYSADITWQGMAAAYLTGLPVDLVQAIATVFFLAVGAKPLIEKVERVQVKWGLEKK